MLAGEYCGPTGRRAVLAPLENLLLGNCTIKQTHDGVVRVYALGAEFAVFARAEQMN